jgi:hypothetical protein
MFEQLPERIRKKIIFRECPVSGLKGPCWIWTGWRNKGHGTLTWERKTQYIHSVVYRLLGGTLIEGLEFDHLCRVRPCANPEHLQQVTCKVNLLRGEGIAARNANKTKCVRGHILFGSNLYLWTDKQSRLHRSCRVCRNTKS